MKVEKKSEVLELHAKVNQLIKEGNTPYSASRILKVKPYKVYYSLKKYGKN